MKVSIFGLGYVGCVTAGCLGREGHEVIGVDVVASKVEKLAAGRPTVVETGLDDLIGACRALWAGAPATFHSPTVNFDGMFCSPRPAIGERIPVWFGGKFTPRQIRQTRGNSAKHRARGHGRVGGVATPPP